MMKLINLFVVLPCYNEELNIEKVVEDFLLTYRGHKTVKLKFVLINDGSKDNTLGIIRSLEKIYEEVHVIDHGVNRGLGAAVATGIDYVLKTAKLEDLMLVLDSDHTHKAVYSLDMVDKVYNKHHDVVIASRFYPGSKVIDVPSHRKVLSIFAKWYYTFTLNIPNVKDYTCGYRVYYLESLIKLQEVYGEKIIEETGFSCMVELLLKLNNIGANIGESTFELYYGDKGGKSSMQIFRTINNSLKMPLKLRQYKKTYSYNESVI